MDHAPILLGIALVHLLAIASPGPTFMVVASYSLSGRTLPGLLVTAGVVLATLVWSSLAAAGLGTVLGQYAFAYRVLQLAGAAYLVYLGAKLFLGARRGATAIAMHKSLSASGWAAVRAGFITNITNPKVVAYYASLFGVMIPADAPGWLFWGAAATALIVSAVWWTAVTYFFSVPIVSRTYERVRPAVDLIMGVVLILLGVRIAALG